MTTGVTHDVVVLGSGAAAMSAALAAVENGASVGVYEKAETIGGTTALSAGITWLPIHPHPVADGAPLTREDAMAYLLSLSNGTMREEVVRAFVDASSELVEFVESTSAVRFRVIDGFPDYHPERPGGRADGGRSLGPAPLVLDGLDDWVDRISSHPGRPYIRALPEEPDGEYAAIPGVVREHVERLGPVFRVGALGETARGRTACFGGVALIAGLLEACLARGVTVSTGSRAVELVVEGRAVTGVVVEQDGALVTVGARRGVVIATGGFEWDEELVASFLRGPMDRPASIPTNTGDGLRMAMAAGAALGNMREAWWVPAVAIPGDQAFGQQRFRSVRFERTRPGCILVNGAGRRFVNEAANYNAVGPALHDIAASSFSYRNLPAWLVFDHAHLERFGFLGVSATGEIPPWVASAPTLGELALAIGISAQLEETVASFNDQVRKGRDDDFGRGDSAYDGWWGDWSRPGTLRTLGEIDAPPYYAVEIRSGTLGTCGGPLTDENGQVLHVAGDVIPGLYAAGNAMAACTGMAYGGAGGTIGPALVWGYRAGVHAAGANETSIERVGERAVSLAD